MNRLLLAPCVLLPVGLAGCRAAPSPATATPETVRAEPLPGVGGPDDAFWQTIPPHEMTLDAEASAAGGALEPGRFRLARDGDDWVLHAEFDDADINSVDTTTPESLFLCGDVAEWFIGTPPGPGGVPGAYLELHAAPDGRTSAFRIDRPGLYERIDPGFFHADVEIRGTLNDASDRDDGWSVVFRLPSRALNDLLDSGGGRDDSDARLTTLVGRYNYGHHFAYAEDGRSGPELTMWPTQPRTAFHLRPFHARIIREGAAGQSRDPRRARTPG